MHYLISLLFGKTWNFGRRPAWLNKKLLNELKCKARQKVEPRADNKENV